MSVLERCHLGGESQEISGGAETLLVILRKARGMPTLPAFEDTYHTGVALELYASPIPARLRPP